MLDFLLLPVFSLGIFKINPKEVLLYCLLVPSWFSGSHCPGSWFVLVPEPVQVPPPTRRPRPPAERSSKPPTGATIRRKRGTKDWFVDVRPKESSSGVGPAESRPQPDSAPPAESAPLPRPARTSLGYISTPLIWQGRKWPMRRGPTPSRAAAPRPMVFITKPSARPTESLPPTDWPILSEKVMTSTCPLVAEPEVSPLSLAPPLRRIRPPAELDWQYWTRPPAAPGPDPAGELPPEDQEEPGAGPPTGPGPGGQTLEEMFRPTASSDLSSVLSSPLLHPSARPQAGPDPRPGPGPTLLMTLEGPLKNFSPSVSPSNHHRDLLVMSLAEENQTQIPQLLQRNSDLVVHQDQTWWDPSSLVPPTLPGPSPLHLLLLLLQTGVSPPGPPGPWWPSSSGHVTPSTALQTGRRKEVASSSSSTLAPPPSEAPGYGASLTSLLTEEQIFSVVESTSLLAPPPPVSHTPPPSSPPSPPPPPAERNQEHLILVTDQSEPRTTQRTGPSSATPLGPLPPSHLQTSSSAIHSMSDGQSEEGAGLQSEEALPTSSLPILLTTTSSLGPAPQSGPTRSSASTPPLSGGPAHLIGPSPLPQPRPLRCLLAAWLCGRSSANRTCPLRTAAVEHRANQGRRCPPAACYNVSISL